VDAYVFKAALAARDLDYLAQVRASLRQRFEASALGDAPGLARTMEDGYRRLWRAWCVGADVPSRLQSAARAFAADDLQGVLTGAEAVLLTSPGQPDALHLRGLVAHRQGRIADGVTDLIEAALRAPNDPELRWNLAAMLRMCGRLDEAVEQAEVAVHLAPEAPEAHNNLATALRAVGRLDEARVCLERAVALRPDYAEALQNLQWLDAA
jgi:Flp pilus assembly protein TadD